MVKTSRELIVQRAPDPVSIVYVSGSAASVDANCTHTLSLTSPPSGNLCKQQHTLVKKLHHLNGIQDKARYCADDEILGDHDSGALWILYICIESMILFSTPIFLVVLRFFKSKICIEYEKIMYKI